MSNLTTNRGDDICKTQPPGHDSEQAADEPSTIKSDCEVQKILAEKFKSIRKLMEAERPSVRFSSSFALLAKSGCAPLEAESACDVSNGVTVLCTALEQSTMEGQKDSITNARFRVSRFEDSGREYFELTFQAPGQHVTWLADAMDPEVQEAISSWEREGCAYLYFRGAQRQVLKKVQLQLPRAEFSQPQAVLCLNDTAAIRGFLYFTSGIADSGMIHATAPQLVRGRPLCSVSVNVLLTRSSQPLVEADAVLRELAFLSEFTHC